MKPKTIAFVGLLALAPHSQAGSSGPSTFTSPAAAPMTSECSDEWSFMIAPYVWVASIDAKTSLPWNGSGNPSSEQRLDTKLTGAFMMEAQARYGAFGLLGEFNWLRLDTNTLNSGTLFSGADLKSDYIYATGALTYTLPLTCDFHMDLLAGARLWDISTDFTMKPGLLPGFQGSSDKTWVSPVIGTNLRYDLSEKWKLIAQGVWGGFTNSNTQWDLFGGFGYQFSDWCTGVLGYRYLSETYESSNYTFNAEAQGAQLGVVFKF